MSSLLLKKIEEGMSMVHSMEHKIWAGTIFTLYYFLLEHQLNIFQIPFWPAFFMAILGAHFPDFDLDFGVRYHRSPITHSALIPTIIFLYYLYFRPEDLVLILLSVFFLGYSSHLILDIFPSKASLLKRISSIFKNYVPGNVKGIPKRYEKKFLVVSGIICFLYASVYLILVRI